MSSKYNDYDHIFHNPFELSPESTAALRNKIDTEIAELKSRLQYISAARNGLAPIHRLPNELLGKFLALCRVGVDGRIVGGSILPPSWVSRRWREVALSNPGLWDRIDSTNRRCATLFLLRSKTVPLSLDISQRPFAKETVVRLFNELPRIQEINFGSWETELSRAGDDLSALEIPEYQSTPLDVNSTATVLQTLTIHTWSPSHTMIASVAFPMPNLTYLQLQGYCFQWREFLIPPLKTLRLIDMPSRSDVSDLLPLLSRMPLLEEITMIGVLHHVEAAQGTPLQRIHLPNLTKLSLEDRDSRSMIELVNHLTIPDDVSLSLTLDASKRSDVRNYVDCLRLLEPLFRFIQSWYNPGARLLDTLSIYKLPRHLSIALGHQIGNRTIGKMNIGAKCENIHAVRFIDIAQSLLRLPLHGVKKFQLGGLWAFFPEMECFLTMLTRIPTVEELHVNGHAGRIFFARLADSPTASLPPGIKALFCGEIYAEMAKRPLESSRFTKLAERRKDNWLDAKMILTESEYKKPEERLGWLEDLFDEVYYGKKPDLLSFDRSD